MSKQPRIEPSPTRRGVLLGAGLVGLGGALAGCSTVAVPYDANEDGVVEQPTGPTPSAIAMPATGGMPTASSSGAGRPDGTPRAAQVTGTVLASTKEIPVGGGKIFPTERVVVTQPARGTYRAFSAVCTHVGCILNQISDGTINCPCHGSEFKITNGAVVAGPAPRPLPKKPIKIVDVKVVLL
ncbi:MAG: Rieske (2Fe-2S) protein [Streptosporangiaceae bacterium]